MGVKNHSEVGLGSRHGFFNLTYPDQAARESDDTLEAKNLFNGAIQLDDGSKYVLMDLGPPLVWHRIFDDSLDGDLETASLKADGVTEVFNMADFPAAVAGVRTLSSGKYLIKADIVMSPTERFELEPGATVTIENDNSRQNRLIWPGTGTLFTAVNPLTDVNPATLVFQEFNVVLTGANATVFDITGGVFTWLGGAATFAPPGATGGTVGTVRNAIVATFDTLSLFGFENGILSDQNSIAFFKELVMISAPVGTGTFITLDDGEGQFATFDNIVATLGATQNLLDLRPCLSTRISVTGIKKSATGNFFKSGTTGPIASFTDVSTAPTAVSATDDGGDALFTSVAHGLEVNEKVTHTTFTEASYNGTYCVSEKTADTYKVKQNNLVLPYVSNNSGLFETTTCQVNDVAHGLSTEDCVSIFGTINFDGGYKIFNVQTDTFEVSLGKAFPGSESTGNWDLSSLTQKSPYVSAEDNGDQADSANRGSIVVSGNAVATSITIKDQFEDLKLNNSAVEASDNELWTLTDSDTGELRYDGVFPASLSYRGLVSTLSVGVANRYDFQLLHNGTPLDPPDNVDIPVEVGTAVQSAFLLWGILAHSGDKFRLQVANRDNTDDITIDTLKVLIS